MLKLKIYLCTSIIFILFHNLIQAQTILCRIVEIENDTSNIINKNWQIEKSDSIAFYKKTNNIIQHYIDKGFINAYLRRIFIENNIRNFEIIKGAKFTIAQAKIIDNTETILHHIELDKLEERKQLLLNKYENSGFPFVNIVSSIEKIEDDNLYLNIKVNKGNIFYFDTIHFSKKANVRSTFLSNYLRIKSKSLYNEKNVKEIDKRLRQLPYIEILKPSQIQFVENLAKPIIHISNKKNSEFDFLIGLLPNNNTGKMQFSGNAKLNLSNPFGNGMAIKLNWQALQAGAQMLNLSYYYPYIAQLPIASKLGLSINKMDTTFLEIDRNIAFQNILNERNYIEVKYTLFSSNLLNVDTNFIKLNKKLPAQLDIKSSQYALAFNFDKTDNNFNPQKGIKLLIMLAIVNRTWRKNAIIENLKDNTGFNFATLYDTIFSDKTQYRTQLHTENYLKLNRYIVLANKLQSQAIFSNKIWQNESYRIGGINTIRGFDDQSIYTTKYILLNNELRFIIAKNSYFLILNDVAFAEQKWALSPASNTYLLSFGAGLTLETKAGIFQINYAIGKTNYTSLQFKLAKIHFGYVNLF